jgi:DNA (cytosine-5)-methyltransferase 1
MTRRRALDLFCKAGGASAGYHRAGFDVVGVDIAPQPRYPFEFVRGDALEVGAELLASGRFDVVVGSPPCHDHGRFRAMWPEHGTGWLVAATRHLFERSGLPWVIENVPGAPLRDPLVLCGSMFGLGTTCSDGVHRQLRRHRLFESSLTLAAPGPCDHTDASVGVYGHGGGGTAPRGEYNGAKAERVAAMGIDWMTNIELAQAIPPAYTEWVGSRLMATLEVAA